MTDKPISRTKRCMGTSRLIYSPGSAGIRTYVTGVSDRTPACHRRIGHYMRAITLPPVRVLHIEVYSIKGMHTSAAPFTDGIPIYATC